MINDLGWHLQYLGSIPACAVDTLTDKFFNPTVPLVLAVCEYD